ncbi:MAG: hypothetical protein Q9215_007536 [Flavoplaca cf. flavocitrina]
MASSQQWLFVLESTYTVEHNVQAITKANFLALNPSRAAILKIVDSKNHVSQHTFWIHSRSMSAAVQLLDDMSIIKTADIYCSKDPIVTIYVRNSDDESPNISRAVSHATTLNLRRQVSGQVQIPEVIVRPPRRNTSSSLDIISQEPVRSLAVEDQVILDLGKGKQETYSKEYLLGWIGAEMRKGVRITDIVVESIDNQGKIRKVLLTSEIWITSLIRGPWKGSFVPLFQEGQAKIIEKNAALDNLKKDPRFELAAKLFIRDLKTFGSDPKAQDRLMRTGSKFYLGEPYFSKDGVEMIKKLPVGQNTLAEELDKLWDKKTKTGANDEICASHDLAPLYGAALGIDWKTLRSDTKALMDITNLSLEGEKKPQKSLKKSMSRVFNTMTRGKKPDDPGEGKSSG